MRITFLLLIIIWGILLFSYVTDAIKTYKEKDEKEFVINVLLCIFALFWIVFNIGMLLH